MNLLCFLFSLIALVVIAFLFYFISALALFADVIKTSANQTAASLRPDIAPEGANCSPIFSYRDYSFQNDCAQGTIQTYYLNLTITCKCNCTNKWAYKYDHDCNIPRLHKLGCRYGGPRWYANCWNAPPEIERKYTALEDYVETLMPVQFFFNFSDYTYSVIFNGDTRDARVNYSAFVDKTSNFKIVYRGFPLGSEVEASGSLSPPPHSDD